MNDSISDISKEEIKGQEVQNKIKFFSSGEFYHFAGITYDISTGNTLTGTIKTNTGALNNYDLRTYTDGKLSNLKIIIDSQLVNDISLKNDLPNGKSIISNKEKIQFFNYENGFAQGKYIVHNLRFHSITKVNIANGLYHGKIITTHKEENEITYYNKGQLVENSKLVEPFDKINFENAIEFKKLNNKNSKLYNEEECLFNGISYEKKYGGLYEEQEIIYYYYIKDGVFYKKITIEKVTNNFNYPAYYLIKEIIDYKDDKIIKSSYVLYFKEKEEISLKESGEILKETSFSSGIEK